MKKILFYFLVLSLGLFLSFNACSKKEEESGGAWSKQRAVYNEGFRDGMNGKKANPKYETNKYYTDGYAEGNRSVVLKDELI